MTRAGPLGAVGRVLTAHRGPLVAVAVVTLLATVAAALVAPLLGLLATAGIRYDLHRASAADRDVQAVFTVAQPGPPGAQQAFDGVDASLRKARAGMPAALRDATGPGEYVARTDFLSLGALPSKAPAFVSMAADPGFAGRSHIVAGRAPRPTTNADVIEAVLSRPVARSIGWPVGTSRTIESEYGESELRLVGLFAADHVDDTAWAQTPSALRPSTVPVGVGGRAEAGVAYVARGSFGAVAGNLRSTQGRAWFPLRDDAVSWTNRADVATDARRFLGRLTPLPSTASGSARFSTGLPTVLDAAGARNATVSTLAAALGSGPLVAVLGLQVLVARLALERDTTRWVLLRARGAGRRQRGALAAALVGIAAVPAAVLGAAVAALLLLGRDLDLRSGPTLAAVAASALATALVPVVAAAVVVPGRPPDRDRGATTRSGRTGPGRVGPGRVGLGRIGLGRAGLGRIAAGAVVVVTAVAAVASLRAGIATTAPGGQVDLLAAALPVLLAATGTVVAVRLLPATLRAVVARTRARSGLSGFVGSVSATRAGLVRAVAVAVAVAGIAVALFGSVAASTLEHGLDTSAHRSVGADAGVQTAALDADQVGALRRVPGVAEVSGLATTDSVSVDTPHGTVRVALLVADTRTLGVVQRGVPGALPVPATLRASASGSGSEAVPVLVSASLARDVRGGADVLGTRLRAVATAPDPVPFTDAAKWMLVDTRSADRLTSTGSVDRVLVHVRPGADVATVATALGRSVPDAEVHTADSVARELAADPRVPGVRSVALVAAVVGAVVGAGSLAATGLLAGPARRERGRLLAVLGADRRQNRALVAAEALPTLVTAVVTAVVVAVGIVLLMLPAADLRSFTASPVRPPVVVDPWLLAATAVAVVVVLGAVLAVEVAAGTPPADRGRGGPGGRGADTARRTGPTRHRHGRHGAGRTGADRTGSGRTGSGRHDPPRHRAARNDRPHPEDPPPVNRSRP